MQLKSFVCMAVVGVSAASPMLYAAGAPVSDADSASNFTVASKTEVPGMTLSPGDYKIQILDHLTDRMIVRVDNAKGTEHTIFLGIPNPSLGKGSQGAVNWSSSPKGSDALRGFAFPSGTAVEFVYPKAEAAALAKVNTARVIAIDPESEGRPANLKNLSNDDMQMVNLWMLSLTVAGPNNKTPALAAQHYQPETIAAPAAPVQAQAVPKATPAPTTEVATLEQPKIETPVARVAPARKPVIAKLPKTGSSLPLVWLVGLVSLGGAAGMRVRRTAARARG